MEKNDIIYEPGDVSLLHNCNLCPRNCFADRFDSSKGYCRTDAGLNIASICVHRGEEPVISSESGICNVFFAGCNLRCIFCQNIEISRCSDSHSKYNISLNSALDRITNILDSGVPSVGFVSPSHMVPQVKILITGLHARGYTPVTVYNSNGYDKKEVLQNLSGMIDVWLPDFKYVTPRLSLKYSGSSDYPEVAIRALKEMYYQVGSTLHTDEKGRAVRGMIIRHLVLPGHVEESKLVLQTIASELSPGVHLSLMSQYHPAGNIKKGSALDRSLYREEYESVVSTMDELGFRNGWVQEMDSHLNYRPDFTRDNPFEQTSPQQD